MDNLIAPVHLNGHVDNKNPTNVEFLNSLNNIEPLYNHFIQSLSNLVRKE